MTDVEITASVETLYLLRSFADSLLESEWVRSYDDLPDADRGMGIASCSITAAETAVRAEENPDGDSSDILGITDDTTEEDAKALINGYMDQHAATGMILMHEMGFEPMTDEARSAIDVALEQMSERDTRVYVYAAMLMRVLVSGDADASMPNYDELDALKQLSDSADSAELN